jgi:hypothetical protein
MPVAPPALDCPGACRDSDLPRPASVPVTPVCWPNLSQRTGPGQTHPCVRRIRVSPCVIPSLLLPPPSAGLLCRSLQASASRKNRWLFGTAQQGSRQLGSARMVKVLISRKLCVVISGATSRPSGGSTPQNLRFFKKRKNAEGVGTFLRPKLHLRIDEHLRLSSECTGIYRKNVTKSPEKNASDT